MRHWAPGVSEVPSLPPGGTSYPNTSVVFPSYVDDHGDGLYSTVAHAYEPTEEDKSGSDYTMRRPVWEAFTFRSSASPEAVLDTPIRSHVTSSPKEREINARLFQGNMHEVHDTSEDLRKVHTLGDVVGDVTALSLPHSVQFAPVLRDGFSTQRRAEIAARSMANRRAEGRNMDTGRKHSSEIKDLAEQEFLSFGEDGEMADISPDDFHHFSKY